jgi:hypothetical protein
MMIATKTNIASGMNALTVLEETCSHAKIKTNHTAFKRMEDKTQEHVVPMRVR